MFRKRPGSSQPPRALSLMQNISSGFPSRIVVSATTLTFAVLQIDTWLGSLSFINGQEAWVPYVGAVLIYILVSFLKINMGSSFPSDCVFSIIPIILIIFFHWIVMLCVRAIEFCPACNGTFCYFDEQQSPATSLITRNTINVWDLHGIGNFFILIGTFSVMSILAYPFEFWQKTIYFFPTIAAIWIFQNMMLCPNSSNNYQGVYPPEKLNANIS